MQRPLLAGFTAIVLLAAKTGSAQSKNSPPQVPEAIQVPAGADLVLVAHASGAQIYGCVADAAGNFSWTLTAPAAELRDGNDQIIGKHSAGPTWKLKDGSAVVGKAAGRTDSPDANSIPWLLVNVVSHSGKGRLDNVTTIQRANTHGGKAPAEGCDASHRDAQIKSSYTADYYFYAAPPAH